MHENMGFFSHSVCVCLECLACDARELKLCICKEILYPLKNGAYALKCNFGPHVN